MSEPRTEAGKRLQTRLAYDRDPASYLPGDFYPEDRAAILAIEAEAASLDGLTVERLARALDAWDNGATRTIWSEAVPFVAAEYAALRDEP